MNRSPTSNKPPIKPKRFFNFEAPKEDVGVSPSAARALFSLAETNQLPSWAVQQIHLSIEEFDRINDPEIPVPIIRALVGDGVLILAPTISGDEIESSLTIWLHPADRVSVYDIELDLPGRQPEEQDIYVVKSEVTPNFGGYTTGNYLEIISCGRG